MLTLDVVDWEHVGLGEAVLPAILVGWMLPDDDLARGLSSIEPCPDWLIGLAACAGGASMYYPTGFGLLLRLRANRARFHGDAARLFEAIEAMAADPDWPKLRKKFPELVDLTFTSGDPYRAEQLARLHRFLSQYVVLPPFDEGAEALVRFAPHDVLERFGGFQVWSVACDAVTRAELLREVDCDAALMSLHRERIRTHDRERLRAAHIATLVETARRLGIAGAPRAYLVWANSD